jgi:hypothetical protein
MIKRNTPRSAKGQTTRSRRSCHEVRIKIESPRLDKPVGFTKERNYEPSSADSEILTINENHYFDNSYRGFRGRFDSVRIEQVHAKV